MVFALEVSRIFFQTKIRTFLRLGLTAAGLFAHTAFIVYHTQLTVDSGGIWLGSWLGWGLGVAWVLATSYLWLTLKKPKSLMGLFLLPITLLLIWGSSSLGSALPFSPDRAKSVWNIIHGGSFMLGTVAVALGCAFSIMYLLNARRLKQKISGRFKLPSLEWLQTSAERSLFISTALFGGGLVSGIAMVMLNQTPQKISSVVSWRDPVIWSSAVLFAWLLSATIFSVFYQPARQGKKIAYLMTISFLFLLLELVIVWQAGHATQRIHDSMAFMMWANCGDAS